MATDLALLKLCFETKMTKIYSKILQTLATLSSVGDTGKTFNHIFHYDTKNAGDDENKVEDVPPGREILVT